jgi:hypothetical protein
VVVTSLTGLTELDMDLLSFGTTWRVMKMWCVVQSSEIKKG